MQSVEGRGRVHLDAYIDGGEHRLDNGRPPVELGWASTIHAAQGRTVDHGVLFLDDYTSAEGLYVGVTRGRQQNLIVGAGEISDVATQMRVAAQRPLASIAAREQLTEPEPAVQDWAEREQIETEREQIEAQRNKNWTTNGNGPRQKANRSPEPHRVYRRLVCLSPASGAGLFSW